MTDGRGGTDRAEVTAFVNPVAAELDRPVLEGLSNRGAEPDRPGLHGRRRRPAGAARRSADPDRGHGPRRAHRGDRRAGATDRAAEQGLHQRHLSRGRRRPAGDHAERQRRLLRGFRRGRRKRRPACGFGRRRPGRGQQPAPRRSGADRGAGAAEAGEAVGAPAVAASRVRPIGAAPTSRRTIPARSARAWIRWGRSCRPRSAWACRRSWKRATLFLAERSATAAGAGAAGVSATSGAR